MKSNLLFVIKSLLLGPLAASAISGLLLGILEVVNHSQAAHQLWPDWLLGIVLGAMLGIVVALITSLILVGMKKQNLRRSILYTRLITGIIIFFLLGINY